MSAVDVPMHEVLHLLPPSSNARLSALIERGVTIQCSAVIGSVAGGHQLTATVKGRTVVTGWHRWISAGLVTDLCDRLQPVLGHVV
ncbi:hypothetical protein [Deinococcus sp.]|uniref:hypothetical protein n=1 Tax=Deinococcus sp. TaxID=47478 RepID=UPI002869BBD8|nr:hypothetical protein [Deinococcus sp.]